MLPYLLKIKMQCLPRKGRQEGTPSPSSCMQGTDCGNVARAKKTVSLPGREETLEIKKRVWEVGTCTCM